MLTLSVLLCVVVFSLATLAVFYAGFQDNLLQCLGLGVVAIGSAAYAWALAKGWPIDAKELLLLVGLAAYSIGTAQKVLHYREKPLTSFPTLEI